MCTNEYKSSYMKFMGDGGLRASFEAIIKKELDTVLHHRIRKWKLKKVAFEIMMMARTSVLKR